MLKLFKNKPQKKIPDFTKVIYKYLPQYYNEDLKIIDIGANRGLFYEEIKNAFPNAQLQAVLIEPLQHCAEHLKQSYSGNSNTSVINCAISNTNGKTNFFINEFDETSSLLQIKKNLPELEDVKINLNKTIQIDVSTLDHLNLYPGTTIDILKMDVQGSEDQVLYGAKDTLTRTRYIWTEVSFLSLYENSCTFIDIYKLLRDSGFILYDIIEGHRSPQNELLQGNCLFRNKVL